MRLRLTHDHLIAVLRISLGVIFVVGGIKLAFPDDPLAFASSYVEPERGWISPFFVDLIEDKFSLEVHEFLRMQGLAEIMLGVMLILGMFTRLASIMMAFMFWAFVAAVPGVGEIRLSRDLALMGLAIASAVAGGGRFSMDGLMLAAKSKFVERKDLVLLLIRISIAFTLIVSALFTEGLFANSLNRELPHELIMILGGCILLGILPRWMLGAVFVWMSYVIGASFLANEPFAAIDSVKRELGFWGGALVYVIAGSDRWALTHIRPKESD